MSRTPPVPTDNQSPFPIAEAPHHTAPAAPVEQATAALNDGVAAARDAVGPLTDKARQFVKDRPWTAAALIGTIGMAVLGSLRRGRL